jgi:hypothetical protein
VLLVYVPRDDYFATFGQLADAVTTAQKVCVSFALSRSISQKY